MTSGRTEIAIGLLWHSINSGNLGVGALTVSNIALLREVCADLGFTPRFTIIGVEDPTPAYVAAPDIASVRIDARFLGLRFWPLLGTLDCVIDIAAGDSWADIYGWRRFIFQWITKLLPIVRRKPFLMSPQTIGPFDHTLQRQMASMLMNRMDAVVARDPASSAVLAAMSPRATALETVDVAFALPFERRAKQGGPIEIGVNISALLFLESIEKADRFGLQVDYAGLTRALLARLTARPDIQVHLIPHVITPFAPREDDAHVIDMLAGEFPTAVRAPDFGSPSEAKSYISGLDLLIGGRMHACIAAFSSGVPVVPIAYSRKFSGLFEDLLGYRHLVPVRGLDTDAALAFILDRIDRREELAAEVASGNALAAERQDRYRGVLRQFLAKAVRLKG